MKAIMTVNVIVQIYGASTIWPVTVRRRAGGGYIATVSNLPECFSYGDTVQEALCDVPIAIQFHLTKWAEEEWQ